MPLDVIGAGFGRTGTDSMREALEILGVGPCHHMFAIIGDEALYGPWRRRMSGEDVGWDVLYAGFRSAVDWPTAHYWRELAAAYPDAKVILTLRDAGDWYDSAAATIFPVAATGAPESLGRQILRQVFDDRPDDRAHCIAIYEAHVDAVRREIPPERLIEHGLGDGWGPLCAGLGLSEPSEPYPHKNTGEGFRKTFSDDS